MSYKLEYIWLDGYKPEPSIRSKTKIVDSEPRTPEECPGWSFDGSSTQQAEGHSSDCLLKPVRIIKDPERSNASLVMCEVLNADGSVHTSNSRGSFEDDPDLWLGFEQEYTIMKNGKPLGFPQDGYPGPQGPYYCSVGVMNCVGRDIVEDHLNACLAAGLSITGINAEVMKGQWEFQLLGKGAKRACDDADGALGRVLAADVEREGHRCRRQLRSHKCPEGGINGRAGDRLAIRLAQRAVRPITDIPRFLPSAARGIANPEVLPAPTANGTALQQGCSLARR